MSELAGKYLCEDVSFTAIGNITRVTACHCEMCRRQNGGGVFHTAVLNGTLKFEKKQSLKWYSSSDWAERGFCNQCGSTFFWRFKDQHHIDLSLGSLESPPKMLDAHIFTDKCGAYETISKNIPHMTAAEVIAAYNSEN